MTMTVPVASMRVARDIREAEAALDEAMICQANLFSSMIIARRETEAGPFTGHEALLRLAKSQRSLLDAGGDLARVHGQLRAVQKELCGIDDCPPEEKGLGLIEQQAG